MNKKAVSIFFAVIYLIVITAFVNNQMHINELKQAAAQPVSIKNRPAILMYHSISDTPVGMKELSVKPSEFEIQIKYLHDNGYTPLYIDSIPDVSKYNKPVFITIDDGYSDNYYNAYPILKKYNFCATIFIPANYINTPQFLTANQIYEMSPLISFQSHTINHMDLTQIGENELIRQCKLSKEIISGITKKPVDIISYPNGKFNTKVTDIVSRYYKYAVTTMYGHYNKVFGNYKLRRIRIARSDSLNGFISKIA